MTARATPLSDYRPSRMQRRANRTLSRALRNGRGPRFMRLLSVAGRHSGTVYTTPVVPVRDDAHTWLVSPFGEVGWVRNARFAGEVELARGDDHSRYRVRELGPEESQPVLQRYLATPARFFAGRQTRDDSRQHPVFELTPI